MRAKTPEGQRLETIARKRVAARSDEELSVQWLFTETMPVSEELATVRGWLIDELEKRMGPERFDAWLWTGGDAVDPAPFLAD